VNGEGKDAAQQDEQISRLLKAGMSPEAYERLMTVKAGDRKVFEAALRYVLFYVQKNQRVDDRALVKILESVSSSLRKDVSISFRRK
jgi:DNA-binding TFAR19-related protein (PDSD5 family)